MKDPDTGKRRSRMNPQSEWIVHQAPELRIIDDELWARTHDRKAQYQGLRVDKKRRPKRLFSGLIFCGVCGAAYTGSGQDRLRCFAHVERGTCDNGHTVKMEEVERRVLDGLRDKLLAGDVVAAFIREYQEGAKRQRQEASGRRGAMEMELRAIERQIQNAVAAISAGAISTALVESLNAAERRKAHLQAELASLETDTVVDFHPSLSDRYKRILDRLQAALNSEVAGTRQAAMEIVRTLVSRIVIFPGEKRGEVSIGLDGEIVPILQIARMADQAGDLGSMVKVVAGAGFEPATFRL